MQHKVRAQADGIAHLTWSPDDSLLLSCGREDSPEAIVFCTQVCSWPYSLALCGISFTLDRGGEVSCATFGRGQSYVWSMVT